MNVIVAEPNWLIILPFGILLLAIAFGPLLAQDHWHRITTFFASFWPEWFAFIICLSFVRRRASCTQESTT